MSFQIESEAFGHGGKIPARYTCEGEDLSPPLAWSDLPDGTKSLALIAEDPDAPDPDAPRMVWIHWVLYNIPASSRGFGEGVTASEMPEGTRHGLNSWGRTGYGGPCPPIGRHRYFFKLAALDTILPDLRKPDKAALVQAMASHVIGETILMGTYQKHR